MTAGAMKKRERNNYMKRDQHLVKFLLLLSVAIFGVNSCGKGGSSGEGSSEPLMVQAKTAPVMLELSYNASESVDSGAEQKNIWKLFNLDTGDVYSPAGKREIKYYFSSSEKVKRIKIYDGSGYTVKGYPVVSGKVLAAPIFSTENKALVDGWNSFDFSSVACEGILFELTPLGSGKGIAEIEVWCESSADDALLSVGSVKTYEESINTLSRAHAFMREVKASTTSVTISASNDKSNPAIVNFTLSCDPAVYRRALLLYKSRNLSSPLELGKRFNSLTWIGGVTVPKAGGLTEWKSNIEEINPAWLMKGTNSIEFASSGTDAEIKEISLILEGDSGWNGASGIPVASGTELTLDMQKQIEAESMIVQLSTSAKASAKLLYLDNGSYTEAQAGKTYELGGASGLSELKLPNSVNTSSVKLAFSQGSEVVADAKLGGSSSTGSGKPGLVISYPKNGEYIGRNALVSGFITDPALLSAVKAEGKLATVNDDGSFVMSISKDETKYSSDSNDTRWDTTVSAILQSLTIDRTVQLYTNLEEKTTSTTTTGGSGGGDSSGGTVDSDGVFSTTVSPNVSKSVYYKDVRIDIPAGAVDTDTIISIIPLRQDQIKNLDAGLTNVTYPAAGYRFLFNGERHGKFKKPVRITFGYSRQMMLSGQTDDDVSMFYYDDELSMTWKRLQKVTSASSSSAKSLSAGSSGTTVTSLSDHFTDIINGTLSVPEHPDPLTFNPNSMKDIKAGDPAAGINIIEAPKANNMGDANLSYPIEIPKGRANLQPNVSLRYNSGGGNGWLGVGWDLSVQSISIDTKWGAARYDGSDTYLLEGQPLVYDAAAGYYRTRVEGAFKKIQRFGDSPSNYYWVVTEKSGVKYFYGQEAQGTKSRVKSPRGGDNGKIFQWNLEKVLDTNGNTINYKYNETIENTAEPSVMVYLSEINYTGRDGVAGPYRIVFTNEDIAREDQSVNCRGGFKIASKYRLKYVTVYFNSDVVRRYEFIYKYGAFRKSLLSELKTYGLTGEYLFHTHTFDYYDEIKNSDNSYKGFSDTTSIVDAALLKIMTVTNILFNSKASIGMSDGDSVNGNFNAGVSPFSFSKYAVYFGGKAGGDISSNRTNMAMIDIDGDGLADQVYINNDGRIYYNKNRSTSSSGPKFESGVAIDGLPGEAPGYDEGNGFTYGGQLFVGDFSGSADVSYNWSYTKNYFTDVDGDGLPDFVVNGRVYFNSLVKDGGGILRPVFQNTSTIPYFGYGSNPPAAPKARDDMPASSELQKKFYRDDPLLAWEAPFAGVVKVSGSVKLLQKAPLTYKTADGITASIHVHKNPGASNFGYVENLWRQNLDPIDANYTTGVEPVFNGNNNIAVSAGDKIYFRVNSNYDGAYDSVSWDPLVEYTGYESMSESLKRDENGFNLFSYRMSEDFSLAGNEMKFTAPFTGRISITAKAFLTANVTDAIDVAIVNNGTVIDHWPLTDTCEINGYSLNVKQGDNLEIALKSDTPIDWTRVRWAPSGDSESGKYAPKIVYSAVDQSHKIPDAQLKYLIFDLPVNRKVFTTHDDFVNTPWIAHRSGMAKIRFSFKLLRNDTRINSDGSVPAPIEATIAIKNKNGVLAFNNITCKSKIVVPREEIMPGFNDETMIEAYGSINAGDELYFITAANIVSDRYSPESIQSYGLISAWIQFDDEIIPWLPGGGLKHEMIPFVYGTKDPTKIMGGEPFGGGFRSWYYGRWNGENAGNEGELMTSSLIVLPVSAEGEAPQDQAGADAINEKVKNFSFMTPGIKDVKVESSTVKKERWSGHDQECYIEAGIISSSRVGKKYIEKDDEALEQDDGSGGGASAIVKYTLSKHMLVGIGAGVTGFSGTGHRTTGSSNTKNEFIDMNGDRFPDRIDGGSAYLTDKTGKYGNRNVGGIGNVRENSVDNININVSPGSAPNPAKCQFDGKGNIIQQEGDPSSIGFGGGFGTTDARKDFIDINGDGLPDMLYMVGNTLYVRLNLGNEFGAAEQVGGFSNIRRNFTANIGANAGFAIERTSYSGGANITVSQSTVETDFIDMNGDGLPDRVRKPLSFDVLKGVVSESGPIHVSFNTGNGFTEEIKWSEADGSLPLTQQETYGGGGGGSFTYKCPVWIPFTPIFFTLHVGGGVSLGFNQGKSKTMMQDFDGDGLVDHVYSDDDSGKITAYLNSTGKTNLLKTVKNQLGARYSVEYTRKGNTSEMPQSKWAMTRVVVNDGMPDDDGGVHTYVTEYDYLQGVHDREERDFYGFGIVKEKRADGSSVERWYETSYYLKGMEIQSKVKDASGNLYSATESDFDLNVIVDSTDQRNRVKYPYMTRKVTHYYEGAVADSQNDDREVQLAAGLKSTHQEYIYDQYGNVTAFTDYGEDGESAGADTITAQLSYDYRPSNYQMDRVASIRILDGNGKFFRQRIGIYDNKGNVREIRQFMDNGLTADTRLDYDMYGNLTGVTSPENHRGEQYRVEYTYDPQVSTYIVKTKDSFGYTSTANYELHFGVPLSTTDTNNATISYSYDRFGRVIRVYSPNDSAGDQPAIMVNYAELKDGFITCAGATNRAGNDGGAVDTVTCVDGLKRVIQVKKSAEVAGKSTMSISGKILYDNMGREAKQGQNVENSDYTVRYTAIAMKNPTTFTYDVMGRKTRTDYPDGTKTTAAYSINSSKFMTISTDQNNKTTMTLRESDGQIIQVTDTAGNATKYTYDAMKQIRTVEDAKGNKTKVTYDSQGRRTSIDNPDAGLVQFYYDPAGNMTKKITPNLRTAGKMIKYIYNYNRLAMIDYPDSNDVTYTYGEAGIGSYRAGRLIKADNGAMSEEFFYGKLGETTKTIRTIRRTVPSVASVSYTTMYKWDNFGRMTSMTYPDGGIVRYFYDRGGLLKSVTGQMGVTLENYAKKIEYDEFGQRTKFVYGNDVESNYTYDDRNRRLTNLKTTKGSVTYQNLNYEYDNVGNILTKENKQFSTVDTDKRNVKHTYTYDDLYRLTGANGQYEREGLILNTTLHNYTNALEYDTIGNITTKNQTHNAYNIETKKIEAVPGTTYNFAYTYGAKPHAVLSTGTRKYVYDENGNMTNVTDTGFARAIAWDEENRIKSNTDNGITTEYKYDSKGERIIKKGSYGEVVYVNNNYAIRNGVISTKNIFAGNTRIASTVINGTTPQGTYFYHGDHLGSSNLITDRQATFKEHLEYFPYGEMWVEERSNSALDIRYAFTGKEYDSETGWYYYGARYLDPRLGMWTTVDPPMMRGDYFSKPGDFETDHNYFYELAHDTTAKLKGHGGVFNPINLNLYHYVSNNPVKYVDPDGEAGLLGALLGMAAGVALDVTLQATVNLIEGKGAFDDLNYSSIAISASVGFATGATGTGVVTQVPKLVDAAKKYNTAKNALNARQIAIAAGKVRDAQKTAKVAERVNDAKKILKKTGGFVALVQIATQAAKQGVDKAEKSYESRQKAEVKK